MVGKVIARIFRFDPSTNEKPRYQEYRLMVEDRISVLALLNRIQQEIDPTLTFRKFCCGLQMCGSCLMKINGKNRFACLTLVNPGETVVVEPVSFPEGHIKDLVVFMTEK